MKKQILLPFFISALIPVMVSCSTNTVPNGTLPGVENKALSFSAKVLAKSYLQRKIETFLTNVKGTELVKELRFEQSKDPLLLKDVLNGPLYDRVIAVSAVSTAMANIPSFRDFMNSLKPVPAIQLKLIYTKYLGGLPILFIKDLATSNETQIKDFGNNGGVSSMSVSPDGSSVLLIQNDVDSNGNGIYLAFSYNSETGILTNLNPTNEITTMAGNGLWLPDGKIVLIGKDNGDYSNIYLTDTSGSFLDKVTDNTNPSIIYGDLKALKDPNKLLYSKYLGGSPNLFIKDLSTGNETQITDMGIYGGISSMSLSPDGSSVLIIQNDVDLNGNGIYLAFTYNSDTGVLTNLTQNSDIAPSGFGTWLPDGRIGFIAKDVGGFSNIYLTDATGSVINKITENTNESIQYYDFSALKSSNKLVYEKFLGGSPDLFINDLSTGNETLIKDFGDYGGVSSKVVSPDGSSLLIIQYDVDSNGNGIYMALTYNSETGTLTTLTQNSDVTPTGFGTWLPDGQIALFGKDSNGIKNIYFTNASGSFLNKITDNTNGGSYFEDLKTLKN
jgi:Tol biopolymer transport system component